MMTNQYPTDAPAYAGGDSGCPYATKHLGYPSSCLNCPFEKCIYDAGDGLRGFLVAERNEKMKELWNEGKPIEELAEMFNLTPDYVRVILRGMNGEYAKR
jgi:hypothetical protein